MSYINRDKINGQTIRILESEGLGAALNCVGKILDGHGMQKHGARSWTAKRSRELERKAVRHIVTEGPDDESGEPHAAHGVARGLMLLSMILRKETK